MLSRLLLATLLIAAVAGCRIKGDPETDPLSSSCASAGYACSEHADCCSFGCMSGLCVASSVEGGLCRTNNDCRYGMRCVAGGCRSGFTCNPVPGDSCTANNDCCSGNCLGEDNSVYPPAPGTCATETVPTVELGGPLTVPYYSSASLSAAVTDPDAEDTFVYSWSVVSVVPPGGLSASWTSTAVSPAFFPGQPGTYTFRVRVTDGPAWQANRHFAEDTVVVYAVNLPPVVDADPVPIATTLRNQPVTLTGSVSDPNLNATPVSCAWYARPPSGAETQIGGGWTSCPPSPSVSFTPPREGPEGDWTFRLQAFDGEFATSDVRVIQVVNAPPVAAACPGCAAPPNARVGNLGPPGQPAPAIPLSGGATDANDDVHAPAGFAWQWIVDSVPAGSDVAPGGVVGSGTGAPPYAASFDPDPDVTGTYVLRLHVDDGRGGSDDDTVEVGVDRYARPLHPLDGTTGLPRGDVADAAYVHASDRIVLVGFDGSSLTSRLWLLDPESVPTATVPSAPLGAAPIALAVKPDGAEALVAVSGSRWQTVSLGGVPGAGTLNLFGAGWSGTATDLMYAGNRMYAVSGAGVVHEVGAGGASNTSTPATCDGAGCAGTRGTFADGYVWLVNGSGEMRRFLGRPNGDLQLNPVAVASGLTGTTDVWISADDGGGRDVFAANRGVFDAASVTSVDVLPYAAIHVDSAAPLNVRRGVLVRQGGAGVVTLDANWDESGELNVPLIGHQGTGYTAEAVKAFIRTDGSAHYVLVRAIVAGAYRWYLVKY
jgi:hypothetical protein